MNVHDRIGALLEQSAIDNSDLHKSAIEYADMVANRELDPERWNEAYQVRVNQTASTWRPEWEAGAEFGDAISRTTSTER